MAGFREITDPAEAAAIFGGAPMSGSRPSSVAAPRQMGGVREVTDPAEIEAIFGKPASFADRFRGDEPDQSPERGKADEALRAGLRTRADEMLVGKPGLANQAAAGLLSAANSAGLNIPRNVGAGLATAAGALGVPGYGDRSFSENYQLAKEQEDALSRQYPKTSLGGTVAGVVGGAVALPAWSGAATLTGRAAQAGVTAGGYSAAAELIDTKDPTRAAVAGGAGAVLGAGATPLIEKAIKWVGPLAQKGVALRSPDGSLTATVQATLKRAGIDPAAVDAQLDEALASTFATKGASPEAAREALARKYGIDVTRGQAANDYSLQQAENLMARGAQGDEPAKVVGGFLERQREQVVGARDEFGRRLAGDQDVIGSPYDAGELVAGRAAQTANEARLAETARRREADAALTGLRGSDPLDAIDAAATVTEGVRARAAAARGDFKAKYRDAYGREGEFAPGALDKTGERIAQGLANRAEPIVVDDITTPIAVRALRDINNLENLRLVPPRPGGSRSAAGSEAPRRQDADTPTVEIAPGTAAPAPSVGDAVFTPSGRRVDVEYRVVDAGRLATSHGDDLRPNPNYPAELQPRDRSRAASESQISRIAGDLQPERLGASPSAMDGAPIIGPDGFVESGNGRVLAIRRAYQDNGPSAQAYREFLDRQGFHTAGLSAPVLVRVRKTPMLGDERVRFAQESNASPGLSLGAVERASGDAGRLSDDVMGLYRGGDVSDAANRDFVRSFVRNVSEKGEEGALAAGDGSLSLEGAQRVRNALLHAGYGDSSLVASLAETGDESIRGFGNVLADVSGDVARLKRAVAAGQVTPEADMSKSFLEAARVVQGAKARGLKLPEAIAQQDAFQRISPEADLVLQVAYGPSYAGRLNRSRAADELRSAVSEASQQTTDARLFGEPLSARDILAARLRASPEETVSAASPAPPSAPSSAGPSVLAAAERAPIDMRSVDHARKRLVSFYRAAKVSGNATDVRAVQGIMSEFDDQVERAVAHNLFSGDESALAALKEARASYAEYQRTFRPQGAGDDVGRAMQRIVDRDAQPVEVANFLYGSGKLGNTGLSTRLTQRLKTTLGADSPEWAAIQQGYLARVIGGKDTSPDAVVGRIQEALTGPGRNLALQVLTPEQVAGLRSFQTATQLAKRAREAVPDWIEDLSKGGFEPQRVLDELYGRSVVGGKSSSAEYARGLRGFFGEGSPEWAAIRQAGWQKLTSKPEGSTEDFGPQAMANRIAGFVNGNGKSLASVLYKADERATMAEFASVMRYLAPKRVAGGSSSPNSDTTPALGSMLTRAGQHGAKIGTMLGLGGFLMGGVSGAATGFALGKGVGGLGEKLTSRSYAKQAKAAVSGAPRLPPPPRPAPNLGPFTTGTGLAVGMAY